jgi:FkbM family methyltransferase
LGRLVAAESAPTVTYPLAALHPPGDYVSDEIRRAKWYYEGEILRDLCRRLTGGVMVDAGAHIGNHSAYLARYVPHTAIHAFEPWPANLALLRVNVADCPTVVVHPFALGARVEVRSMVGDPNLGHARFGDGHGQDVEVRPLDSLALDDVALLKVDVEGAEAEALSGAAKTLDRWHPLVLIEDWAGRGYAALESRGYRVVRSWAWTRQTFLYA